jgi:hypothetical protein
MTKANLNHPDIGALREMAKRNGWHGCVVIGVRADWKPHLVSYGRDRLTCDAIGATLDDDELADAYAVIARAIREAGR